VEEVTSQGLELVGAEMPDGTVAEMAYLYGVSEWNL
jgi:hypothetical protein